MRQDTRVSFTKIEAEFLIDMLSTCVAEWSGEAGQTTWAVRGLGLRQATRSAQAIIAKLKPTAESK